MSVDGCGLVKQLETLGETVVVSLSPSGSQPLAAGQSLSESSPDSGCIVLEK
jgi:hypothetical protein